jgi:hypothetical protein
MKPYRSVLTALLLVTAFGTLAYARQQDQARLATAGVTAAATSPSAAPADQAKPPVKPAPKPAAKPPEKVGFARVVTNWPKWFTLSIVERGRYESLRPAGTKDASYDGYYLNRLRITAGFKVSPWFQATVQGQDSRVGGYTTTPVIPVSMRDTADLRLAYAEVGKKSSKGVFATVGRQELTFGDGRVMASPDWGNVSKTYDSVRVTAARTGVKVDAFFGAPVDVSRSFSMAKIGERVAGVWATFDKVKPFAYVDGYGIVKSIAVAVGELGAKGDWVTYALGFRVGGPIAKAVSWEAEQVVQTGHYGGDDLQAFGTHAAVSWTIGKSALKPKATADFNYASGDKNSKDAKRGTFDQMYASSHAKWGLGDLVGWRNMQHAALKFEFSATKRLKVNSAVNHVWLATAQDGWYAGSGTRVVLNRKATSRDLGWEPDIYGAYTLTKDVTIGVGAAVLFGGGFVKQSTDYTRLWTSYAMCTYKF